MSRSVNAERVNDRAKLIMHRMIARRLVSDPALLAEARQRIRDALAGGGALGSADEWDRLLQNDLQQIRHLLTRRDETMDRLRVSSPLPVLAGIRDPDLRRRIWKKARLGLAAVVDTHATPN